MGEEIEDYSELYELFEGWREVNGDSGIYYWYVVFGIIQWILFQVVLRLKVLYQLEIVLFGVVFCWDGNNVFVYRDLYFLFMNCIFC